MLLSATLGTICRWRSGCWCRDAPCWRSLCTHNEAMLLNGGAINITDYIGMTTTLARLLKLLGIRRVAARGDNTERLAARRSAPLRATTRSRA